MVLPLDMKFFMQTTKGRRGDGKEEHESIPEKYRPLKGEQHCGDAQRVYVAEGT